MGKSKRSSKRSHVVAIHGSSAYPYSPKIVNTRSKPLQRSPYSASDLRRLFSGVKAAQSGSGSPGSSISLAHRAASGLERLIARVLRGAPAQSGGSRSERGCKASPQHSPQLAESPPPLHSSPRQLTSADLEVSEEWAVGAASETQLKRLGFVLAYADYYFNWGYGVAASLYSSGRALVPEALTGLTGSLEATVTNISAPVLTAVQDGSGKVLHSLDAKVDGVINAATGLYSGSARGGPGSGGGGVGQGGALKQHLDSVTSAKDAYLRRIEEMLLLLRERGLGGAAEAAAEKVVATVGSVKDIPPFLETEARALMLKVGDAWGALAGLPPVARLVSTAQPSIDFALSKYLEAHDSLVAAPSYNKAVDIGAAQLKQIQDSAVYRTLYRPISAVADPALDAIAASPGYAAIVDHLRPQGAPAAASPPA